MFDLSALNAAEKQRFEEYINILKECPSTKDLFKEGALPEGIKVVYKDLGNGSGGGYNSATNTLRLNPSAFQDPATEFGSLILLGHELRHANQYKEGLNTYNPNLSFEEIFLVNKMTEIETKLQDVQLEQEIYSYAQEHNVEKFKYKGHTSMQLSLLNDKMGNDETKFIQAFWSKGQEDNPIITEWQDTYNLQAVRMAFILDTPKEKANLKRSGAQTKSFEEISTTYYERLKNHGVKLPKGYFTGGTDGVEILPEQRAIQIKEDGAVKVYMQNPQNSSQVIQATFKENSPNACDITLYDMDTGKIQKSAQNVKLSSTQSSLEAMQVTSPILPSASDLLTTEKPPQLASETSRPYLNEYLEENRLAENRLNNDTNNLSSFYNPLNTERTA